MSKICRIVDDLIDIVLEDNLEYISVPFQVNYSAAFSYWDELCLMKDGGSENLSSSVADSQTLMSLYFALCTKVSIY